MLEIRLLGQFDVRLEGRPVEIPSRPAQSLLAYLALTAGASHRREKLAGLLWPDTTESNARSNLRHALWRLRGAIEKNGQYLLADALTITFNAEADYWLDAQALQQEFSGDWPAEELMEAVSVYNGELLPGFYDEWVAPERERLGAVFERQMQKLLDRLIAGGRWAEVLAWGERWLVLGGVPEPAYRALMTAYGGLGDKAGVALAYQRCMEALRNELGVEPSAQTQALFEQLSRSEKLPPPPAATTGVQPLPAHNLPSQSTPFIGRAEALAEVAQLLDDPACRLLTLTGPGGIGKTRLALQAAAEGINARKFADGVFFVPLAPLGSVEFIVPAIANAIAFTFYGGMDSKEQLLNYLREKSMLLVMDNFEHLTDGAGLLAGFLESAPGLKCMVTSRERLNLHGEWLIEVEGMRVPESERAERIEEYSAMQLFLQSARRVHARFILSEDDQQYAARICRLVEGLPLAIELASAWVRAISLREIAKEIERNLDFLATTLRDVPERHRSLRAVFDHSWNRLTGEEKRVFRNLSVFRGGFQRQAAEAVANASLPALSALMDKSLLRRNASGRYEIHELLRQYALDKLAEADEETEVRDHHLAYFLGLAEEAEPMLRRAEQLAWLSRLETEHDNLRVALKWAMTDEQLEEGLRLAGSLARFWYLHGYWSEGRDWLKKLLKVSEGESDGRVHAPLLRARAKAFYGTAWLEDESGADAPLYEQSLALCREIDDRWGEAFSLRGLGALAIRQGESERAAELLNESRKLFEELRERWGTALVNFNLGWLANDRDRHDEKLNLWNETLAGFRDVGDRWGMAVTLGALGFSARFEGDYKRAAAMSKESLHLFKELGDKAGMAESLARLASVAYRRSDYKQATAIYEESLALREELGDRLGALNTKGLLGLVAAYQGDYGRAIQLLEDSVRRGEELGGRVDAAHLISYLGTAAYFQGDLDRASELWEETLASYRQFDDRVSAAYSINYLGIVALQRGDLGRAGTLLQEAYDQIRGTGDKRGLALALHGLGRLAHAQGDEARAVSFLKQGLTLRKEMGDKQGIAESLESLAGTLGACEDRDALEGAAKLFGAAEYLREKIGAPLPPVEREAYERDLAAVRAQIDEEAFATGWAVGRGMKLEEVLGEALTDGQA
jgi:predicted ATPase/DNA-binding SARP family transcriptional activator